MNFFDSFPPPPSQPVPAALPRRPAWEQPVYAFPASVPGDVVLLHTERAAVWIGGVRAYPNGFSFQLRAVLRQDPNSGPALGNPFDGHYNALHPGPHSGLRLGIRYADGRRALTDQGMPDRFPGEDGEDAQSLLLMSQGGGGSGLTWDAGFWTYPLPPNGPVTLLGSWPDAGVGEASVDLDGTAIRAAAGRAVRLWPSDEEPDDEGGFNYGTVTAYINDSAPEPPAETAKISPSGD